MSILQDLGSSIGNFLSKPVAPLVGAIGQNILTGRGISDIGQARQEANIFFGGGPDLPNFEGGLMGEIGRQSQFKPFTVRGTTVYGQPSSATVSATGTEFALSPEEAQLQRTLTGFGQQAFGMLGDPLQRQQEQTNIINMLTQDPSQRAMREQDIFSRLQAMQAPETERARLGLEERLFTQGRGGVRTAMFGGTPEQLALEKAIQEQQSRNAVSAMEQARAEQALQSQQTLQGLGETRARLGLFGQLGLGAIPTAYTSQQELIRSLAPQLEASRLGTILQSTGLGLGAGVAESAIEAQLGFEGLRNALRQQQYQGLFDLLKSGQQRTQQTPSNATVTINPQGGGFQLGGALGEIASVLGSAAGVFNQNDSMLSNLVQDSSSGGFLPGIINEALRGGINSQNAQAIYDEALRVGADVYDLSYLSGLPTSEIQAFIDQYGLAENGRELTGPRTILVDGNPVRLRGYEPPSAFLDPNYYTGRREWERQQ